MPEIHSLHPALRIAGAMLTAMAGCTAPLRAQAQAVQPWPTVLVSGPVADGVLLSGEATGRIADNSRNSQIETRFLVGHAFTRHVTGWIGYVHYETYVPNARNTHESQVLGQVNWVIGTLGPLHISTRTRLEQRFIGGVDATSWRWRQQLRVSVPLGGKTAPSIAVSAEPFIALNETTGQRRTRDQLRTFVGISVPVSPHADIEIGYLNQRLYRAGPTLVNNAIPVNLTVHF
ncbi:DUF2490 domain-containing protein [Novosphingobium sp.]|uniref:DUF2490 domain-containing protein n=1 Tax=Novosphingobium sp. TaxID=1874826 RepID=UPI003340A9DB